MNLISLFLLLAYPKLLNQKKSQPTTMQRTQEKHMIYKHIPPHQRRFRQKIRKKCKGSDIFIGGEGRDIPHPYHGAPQRLMYITTHFLKLFSSFQPILNEKLEIKKKKNSSEKIKNKNKNHVRIHMHW